MTAPVLVALALAGGLGAVARFVLDGAVAGRLGGGFPFGTLAVNVAGSFLLGILAGAVLDGDAHDILATGLLGSFTTFSTWALESHRLGEDGRLDLGLVNLAVSLVVGLLVVWAGRELGAAL